MTSAQDWTFYSIKIKDLSFTGSIGGDGPRLAALGDRRRTPQETWLGARARICDDRNGDWFVCRDNLLERKIALNDFDRNDAVALADAFGITIQSFDADGDRKRHFEASPAWSALKTWVGDNPTLAELWSDHDLHVPGWYGRATAENARIQTHPLLDAEIPAGTDADRSIGSGRDKEDATRAMASEAREALIDIIEGEASERPSFDERTFGPDHGVALSVRHLVDKIDGISERVWRILSSYRALNGVIEKLRPAFDPDGNEKQVFLLTLSEGGIDDIEEVEVRDSIGDVYDTLYAVACAAHSARGLDFADAAGIDPAHDDQRHLAAVRWAADTGNGSWRIRMTEFYGAPGGERRTEHSTIMIDDDLVRHIERNSMPLAARLGR